MSKLTAEQFKKLKELLSTAKQSTAEEFEELNRATDGVYGKYFNQDMEHDNSEGGADKHVTSTKITSYSLKNTELKNFVSEIFEKDPNSVNTIHTSDYGTGDSVAPHYDVSTFTVVIITEDGFEGGEFYLKGEYQPQFKSNGDYITYHGKTSLHEVKEVTQGMRQTLTFWFNEKKPLFQKLL